ncbi:hypothetical protein PR048_022884 [Dryococelus australis]|uniref:Uncharacterized protein n=1 Tax=Dryococelus australis TaxID=614101 RepID=A0ABQ9GSM2_9NEOP|nr:hypothetical protein PR048_022884 [Dryococelus australis]
MAPEGEEKDGRSAYDEIRAEEVSFLGGEGRGGWAVRLLACHLGESCSIPGRVTPDFRKWESCWTMLLAGGFSWRYSISYAHSFRRCSIRRFTLIGSQELDLKSCPNLFTFHSLHHAQNYYMIATLDMVNEFVNKGVNIFRRFSGYVLKRFKKNRN